MIVQKQLKPHKHYYNRCEWVGERRRCHLSQKADGLEHVPIAQYSSLCAKYTKCSLIDDDHVHIFR